MDAYNKYKGNIDELSLPDQFVYQVYVNLMFMYACKCVCVCMCMRVCLLLYICKFNRNNNIHNLFSKFQVILE